MSMEFIKRRSVKGVAVIAAGVMAAGIAFKSGGDASNVPVDCTPVHPLEWVPTDPYFNSRRAAGALGVSEALIQNGSMGEAHCPDGVEPALIEDARALVRMQDTGVLCLAFGIQSFDLPDFSLRQKDVVVVCPGGNPDNVTT